MFPVFSVSTKSKKLYIESVNNYKKTFLLVVNLTECELHNNTNNAFRTGSKDLIDLRNMKNKKRTVLENPRDIFKAIYCHVRDSMS